jgi:hypothetical protein
MESCVGLPVSILLGLWSLGRVRNPQRLEHIEIIGIMDDQDMTSLMGIVFVDFRVVDNPLIPDPLEQDLRLCGTRI